MGPMQHSPFIVHTVCLLHRELGDADERCPGPDCPLWAAGAIDEMTCLVGQVEVPLRRSPALACAAGIEEALS
jgi:hypothetical protein